MSEKTTKTETVNEQQPYISLPSGSGCLMWFVALALILLVLFGIGTFINAQNRGDFQGALSWMNNVQGTPSATLPPTVDPVVAALFEQNSIMATQIAEMAAAQGMPTPSPVPGVPTPSPIPNSGEACDPVSVSSLAQRSDAVVNGTLVSLQVRDTNACARPLWYNETGIATGANFTMNLPEGWSAITASVTAEVQREGGEAVPYMNTPVIVIHGPFKGGVGLYEGAVRIVPTEWVEQVLSDTLEIQRLQTGNSALEAVTFSG